jgi:outer membrane immunogenic protein
MTKNILVGVAIAALSALPAVAADIPVKAPVVAPVMAPAVYNWTGVYIGGNVGGGWGRANYQNTANTTFFGDVSPPPSPLNTPFNHNTRGFIGGGQIGYNWQSGSFVFGVEAMFDYSDIKGGINPLRGGLPPLGMDDNFETRIRSLFLATARVGHAWNNWLIYAKGGYAGGDVRVSVSDVVGINQGSGSASSWRSGWTVGAGVEYGITPNWTVAGEYNYVRLQSGSYQLAGAAAPALYTFDVATRDTHLALVKLNYKFNWGGPVVARY